MGSLYSMAAFLVVSSMGIAADYGMGPVQTAIPPLAEISNAAQPSSAPNPGVVSASAGPQAIGPDPGEGAVRLPGHVLSALSGAEFVVPNHELGKPDSASGEDELMTLTLTLKRDDAAGFERYLHDVYDPRSKHYRHFLTQTRLTQKFGPSRESYGAVTTYLQSHGLTLAKGSDNRLTLTVRGPRKAVEAAFATKIGDYKIGDSYFYANTSDPALPAALAKRVAGIGGLNDLAHPQHLIQKALIKATCVLMIATFLAFLNYGTPGGTGAPNDSQAQLIRAAFTECVNSNFAAAGYGTPYPPVFIGNLGAVSRVHSTAGHTNASASIDGTGQTIGLVEFDTFKTSDVADFLALTGAPSGLIANLSEVAVNGGVSAPGSTEDEVLLDIDDVLVTAPGAKVKVFDAPFNGQTTSYTEVFNAMLNSGVTVISNSWASCEDQTTLAEAQAVDQVLQSAAASGVSVFNGTGDTGSTCLDGSANTISVPADSPNATAVGGSSLVLGPGLTYQSETWWDGSASTPATGQGGYGVSKFFPRPSYQSNLNAGAYRSVPDVVANADPAHGVVICQADNGGCPSGYYYGGTSSATPIWAGFAALLNQAAGKNLGNLNAVIYPLSGTKALHSAASMGSDFAHVGLGSPNMANLELAVSGQTTGAVSAGVSQVYPFAPSYSYPANSQLPSGAAADGSSPLYMVVRLWDANGNPVSGKTVTLSTTGSAVVSPSAGVTSGPDGSAVFTVTDSAVETLNFTAKDSTDGIVLTQVPSAAFGPPSATSAGITANPSTVAADGTSTATITITLKNASNQASPGKTVTVSDSGAHAVLTGPSPAVTDANGQIVFTATDQVAETVTFSAVDVSDGNLPFPGTATVTYSNATNTACGVGTLPVAGSGYTITPYITGLPAASTIFYGNANIGCPGANNPAFTSSGAVLASDFLNGNIYQIGLAGGAVTSGNVLGTLTPALGALVYGKDGSVYATLGNEGAEIVQVDPATGAQLRVVASGLTCPAGLSVDPLSGDLFFDDQCTGGGTDNASIFRVIDPADTDTSAPTSVVTYATLPTTPNGGMAFAPNGTLYAVSGYYNTPNAPVEQISGTNSATVTVSAVTGITSSYTIAVGAVNTDGSAQSLIVDSTSGVMSEVPIASPSTATVIVSANAPGAGVVGPDGCLYSAGYDTIYKIANSTGGCGFASTSPAPSIKLTPAVVSPNPAQGSSQSFTATLQNVGTSSGVPVKFSVTGVNTQTKLADTATSGSAAISYTAIHAGGDRITATATVNGTTLTSNTVPVTWTAGKHVTFLSLNTSPQGATIGQPVSVVASLSDVSASPASGVSGQTVTLTLGSASCTATTNGTGVATCALTPSQTGNATLTASFAGSSTLAAATESAGIHVSYAPTPAPTVSIAVSPTTIAAGASASLTWSSSNASACAASGAWSGSESLSGTQTVSPANTGSYSYTLTCTGTGGTATATAVLSATLVAVTVTAKSGGGAVTWPLLLMLALLVTLRIHAIGRMGRPIALCLLVGLMIVGSGSVRAESPIGSTSGMQWWDPFYVGVRVGSMPTRLSAGNIDNGLASDGYPNAQASTDNSSAGYGVYLGYEFLPHFDIEYGYTHRGSHVAEVTGTLASTASVLPLLRDTAGLIRSYGSIYSMSLKWRDVLLPRFSLDPRFGAFYWDTKVTDAGGGTAASTTHGGGGLTAGLGLSYRLWRGLTLGAGADIYRGFPENTAALYSGSLEWRFGASD